MKLSRLFLVISTFCIVSSSLIRPEIRTVAAEQLPETNRPAIQAEIVEFDAFDNSRQLYMEYVPETFDSTRPATLIITLHGHGSDCGQIFNGVYGEFNAVIDAATKHNGIVVSPQYRETTSWMGPAAERDVLQIIQEQRQKRRIDKTIIAGASMGGSSTLTFTALHPELIDGAVAMNGTANHLEYENFQDAISESFGGSKSDVPMEYKNRSAELFPESFLNVSTAITLGGQDLLVPPDSARRLAQMIRKIGGDVLLLDREETGHTTSYADAAQAMEYVFNALYKAE